MKTRWEKMKKGASPVEDMTCRLCR